MLRALKLLKNIDMILRPLFQKKIRSQQYMNLRCIATCGSNIKDYEVVQAYGIGTTIVNCSAHNYALGCGFKAGNEIHSNQSLFEMANK